MTLSCIGCGPGDPDLLTVKAVERIRNADAIFTPTSKEGKPSIALSIARKYIDESSTSIINLIFPMIKDKDSLRLQWKINSNNSICCTFWKEFSIFDCRRSIPIQYLELYS